MIETAIVLFVLSLMFFIAEAFIPSGGILGFVSFGCLVAAVICLFNESQTAGMIGLFVSLILVPTAIAVAFKVFPHTWIGRAITLNESQEANTTILDPSRDVNPDALIGATGVSESKLRPVGICKINGKRIECIADQGYIDAGKQIRVEMVRGLEVRVRQVSDDSATNA